MCDKSWCFGYNIETSKFQANRLQSQHCPLNNYKKNKMMREMNI